MNGILAPIQSLLNRFSVPGKILLMGLFALITIAVVAFPLLQRYAETIAFSEREKLATPLIAPAMQLMRAVQGHRGASQGVLGGNQQLKAKMDEFAAAAGKALAAGAAAQHAEALPKQAQAWHALQGEWSELQAQALQLPAPDSLKRHSALVGRIQDYIGAVAAATNAALDPVIATNYLQAVFADHLPKMVEALGLSRALTTGAAAKRELDWTVRVDLMILRRAIEENRMEIEEHLAGASAKDASIKAAVDAGGKEFLAATLNFLDMIDKEILDPATIAVPPPKIFEVASQAVDTGYAVVEVTMKEFDRQLQMRIDSQVQSRNVTLGIVALALTILVLLYFGFRRALLEAIGAIRAGAERIANGDLTQSVTVAGDDELAQIGQAVNRMQENLHQSLERERIAAAENLRIRIALDNVSTGVMIADNERKVIYANKAVVAVLRGAQDDIRRQLPAFDADRLVGTNIDSFHKHPAHQAKLLSELTGTHVAHLEIGARHMTVAANPVIDPAGQRLGAVAEWRDRTQEVRAEQALKELLGAAVQGDFSRRIDADAMQGFFHEMATGMNQLTDIVARSLDDIARVLNAVAGGNLSRQIEADYAGTLGQLKNDTNATVTQLRDVVGQIIAATEAINTAAKEIAAGNQDLSSRTEEQASSLEETASSMEQLNATVKQNAESARQANALATRSNEVAARGGEMVKQVVATMSGIQASSKKIADIVGVIDSIAFQTNILALNAAVEAARAGEQGRGFAVVATEVRNLAQRSATAAKEIKALIAESVDKVEGGAQLVNEAGTTMDEVVTSFQQVARLVVDISNASREQSGGIEQVTQAVSQMDEVTQQNAALVEQAAAAAESLEEQAQGLRQAVAMFRLDGGAVLPAPTFAAAAGASVRARPARSPGVARRLPPARFADDEADEWAEY